MDRSVAWEWLDEPGLEHLRIQGGELGVRATGIVVGSLDGRFSRIRYRIGCTAGFVFRTGEVEIESAEGTRTCRLDRSDGGLWTVDGDERRDLDGCIDVDVMVTPFTNTLPIRRLGLFEGESATVDVAYVSLPDLAVSAARQDYDRLAADRYRYSDAGSTFTAELTIDSDGLVVDYGDIWRRVR